MKNVKVGFEPKKWNEPKIIKLSVSKTKTGAIDNATEVDFSNLGPQS